MKKTFRMFVALALVMLGTVNVSAGEIISLQEVPFWQHEGGWGLAELKNTNATFEWVVDQASGLPYGDSNVNNFADLSLYSKLYVTVTAGTPRFLLNRDIDEGQWSDNEAESHLIDNTKGGWSARYFTSEAGENEGETVYIVDLKQLNKDKGFAHLHAIKGANWSDVTIISMTVEQQTKQQVGWTSIINNGNFEGDDVSSFPVALDAVNVSGVQDPVITDGVGVNQSRGLAITTISGATQDWATQLFVKFNEGLPENTKWRFSMDVRAELGATVSSGCHGEPRSWIAGGIIPEFTVSNDWTTVTAEGTIGSDLADKLGSIAFDLNRDRDNENTFYFDNIKFEVFKLGTVAEFYADAIQIDFGFDTNIPDLVAASGKTRLMFPKGCVKVTVNGQDIDEENILSVEGFADGRFYIFMAEPLDDDADVNVQFTNPTDVNYHLIYKSGIEGDVIDYDGPATLNEDLMSGKDDVYSYAYAIPTLMKADPEDGSFNLPNDIREFTLTFDKLVDCKKLRATLGNEVLTVTPAEGAAEVIVLVRESTDPLPTDQYVLQVRNVCAEYQIDEEWYRDYDITLNIGKVEYDPEDQPKDLISDSYFANCKAGGIPEGFIVNFQGTNRTAQETFGSGPRMFDFAAGGDFTKGLYFREGYVEYGTVDGYALTLEAGKKYNIHFNTAMWKDNGSKTRFRILDEAGEPVYTEIISNTPNVNGSTGAVTKSTSVDIKFYPEADGNYVLRWESAGDETSDPGYMEILLANVAMKYTPNQVGYEETLALQTALDNAKKTRDGNTDERYDGAAFDELSAAILKYEAEMETYTAPSAFLNAAADLDAKREAMNTHRQNCDSYDTQIKKAIDVERQNAEKKFAKTELYAELSEIVAKYHGSSEWVNVNADVEPTIDPETGDEIVPEEKWELTYSYDVLKDDAVLPEAIAELTAIAKTTSLMFTEGESKCSDTGVKVAIERIRLGAEDLKGLGVEEEGEPIFEEATNALTDDDALIERMKEMAKAAIYGQLKDPANEMFAGEVDEVTLEEVTPTYDVTVFVKNPNIYKLSDKLDFTDEAVPGWTTPEGYNRPGLTAGWSASQGTSMIAEDCMFQTWGGSYRVEQTITDLPAGVYTIKFGFGERDVQDQVKGYVFAADSQGLEYTADCPHIGQSYPVLNVTLEQVTVTDGVLTIGVNADDGSHTFFNDVRLLLAGPADVDYSALYDEVTTGVETLATAQKSASVRFIELYDLNGRRITTARKGVQLVKKHMSDGTVRTEKVVRK